MSALRGRDKRAQRINAVEQKRAACEREAWELAPDWWRNLGSDPQSDDEAWRDALASANGRSDEVNGSRG
jgi:hypothetical protein